MLSAPPEARILLTARGVRAVADGLVSLVLPAYLLALGYGPFETGIIATATLTARRCSPSGSASSHTVPLAGLCFWASAS